MLGWQSDKGTIQGQQATHNTKKAQDLGNGSRYQEFKDNLDFRASSRSVWAIRRRGEKRKKREKES